jgi:hypothetical protein
MELTSPPSAAKAEYENTEITKRRKERADSTRIHASQETHQCLHLVELNKH